MYSVLTFVICGLASYLLGAVPFGYLIARAKGVDIRRVGSGNIGATNVARTVGKGWGLLAFLCDTAKGFVPAFFFPLIAGKFLPENAGQTLTVLCACLAVAGHNWPAYLGFKGGKGVATSAGALLGIAWEAAAIGFASWVVIFLSTRYVSVASIVTALVISVSAWMLYTDSGILMPIVLTVLGVVIIYRHKSNIQRLIKGTENRFEFGKKH